MRPLLRVARNDLFEVLSDPRGILLCLVVPVAILLLASQLRQHPPTLDVLITRSHDCDEDKRHPSCRLEFAMSEVVNLRVKTRPEPVDDPLSHIANGTDLVVDFGEYQERPLVYIGETDPSRLAWVVALARGIGRLLDSLEKEGSVEREAPAVYSELFSTEQPPGEVLLYFPSALDRSLALIPGTLALVTCLLPFVLAAPALIREREDQRLGVTLTAPGVTPWVVLAAKAAAVLTMSLIAFLVMLVVARVAYGLNVQSGALLVFAAALLAIVSSLLLGLAVSAQAKSQTQVTIAIAAYFLALVLLSGFLYTLDEASAGIRALSLFSPLTFLLGPANAWMFGADTTAYIGDALGGLAAQCALYGVASIVTYRSLLRQL